MKRHIWAIVCVLVATSVTYGRSDAQERDSERTPGPPAMSGDEAVKKALTERKYGVVVMDVAATACALPTMNVGKMVDGKWRQANASGSTYLFGKQISFGGIKFLEPGEYSVLFVRCTSGAHVTVLNGPFAKFSVVAGQMVNIGVLKLDYKTEGFFVHTGTMHKSVVSTGPGTIARLKEKFPSSFGKMINRPMALIGSADVAIRGR
jgi:hypothetical protein